MPSLLYTLLALSAVAAEPRAVDRRLVCERFAAEPQIVTPTGIAVDAEGRVLAIESHTHFRPKDYNGPPADRIRRFEDTDGDGRADRITTFFEGTTHTMNLAIEADGAVLVATRARIFRLRDRDGDGRAETREDLVRLDTPGDYPHNGLSGFAIDIDGTLYFGMGENLGADYALVGSDGAKLTGGGEGGNVFRCRPDGSKLERVATGFWNPFHMTFDVFGRLFAVDNDPDSRPPCRLLHVVDGGDYGFRFRNGRKGLHPFTAWNGELPGTLPMVAGTGEAPSGIVAYESDGLPADYRGDLLVTSWGDHRIEAFRLKENGASYRGAVRHVIEGGEDFRPVGIAVAPDGSLFVSDWVDKSYNVHGLGRIWHIRAAEPPRRNRPVDPREGLVAADRPTRERAARRLAAEGDAGREVLRSTLRGHDDPRVRAAALEGLVMAKCADDLAGTAQGDRSPELRALALRWLSDEAFRSLAREGEERSPAVRAARLRRLTEEASRPTVLAALEDPDPFLQEAAREGLRATASTAELLRLSESPKPSQRLAALLLLRSSSQPESKQAIGRALSDADPNVRFVAVEWVGEDRLAEFRPQLTEGLAKAAVTRGLFEAYLAALDRLDRGLARDPHVEAGGDDYVAKLLLDPKTAPVVQRRALRMLRADHPALTLGRLKSFLDSSDLTTRLEAVRTLRERREVEAVDLLRRLATDASQPATLRAEAIAGLSPDQPGVTKALLDLARQGDPVTRHQALRSLRGTVLSQVDLSEVRKVAQDGGEIGALAEFVMKHGPSSKAPPPADLDAWMNLLDGPADAAEGERVFFHPQGPGCYRCHAVDGRGGRAGPELSTTAQVLTRRRLVESILDPSREIAPQFVPWLIARQDGSVATGLLVDETVSGDQNYVDTQGRPFTVKAAELAERKPESRSIMPDDLARTMTVQEFRDLLAFLQGMKPAAP